MMKHPFLPLLGALVALPLHAQAQTPEPGKGPVVITMQGTAEPGRAPREIRIVTAGGEGTADERVITRRIIRDAAGPQDGAGMGPEMGQRMGMGMGMGPGMRQMTMVMRRPMLGLQLATVSPRLGSYFGAKSGVLVVKVDNASLKIEDGDVITAIDGRQPTTAEQAQRILGSYGPGEKIGLKLVRDRKPVSLDVVMPEPPKVTEFKLEQHAPHGAVAPPPKAP